MQPKSHFIKIINQNKMTLVCLLIIGIFLVLSVFAFFIIPDKSINSNNQIVQLALKKPLFIQQILVLQKGTNKKSTRIHQLFFGKQDLAEYIPVDSIKYSDSDLYIFYENTQTLRTNVEESEPYIKNQKFLFGTDKYGRDVLSRIVLGLRVSLLVGLLSVFVSLSIGIAIGSAGGYFGGKIDDVIMLIINTSWSIPTLLMAFAIIIAMGKGFLVIVLAIGLTMWVDVARIVRGQVKQTKNELYVRAASVLGYSHIRTIFQHILPNIVGPILVIAAANFATAILVEAGLSFLGLGVQPPSPSLGNMLQEGYAYATGGFVYLAFFPILTIMILVLTFNLLGTSLRDVFDIKGAHK